MVNSHFLNKIEEVNVHETEVTVQDNVSKMKIGLEGYPQGYSWDGLVGSFYSKSKVGVDCNMDLHLLHIFSCYHHLCGLKEGVDFCCK